MFMCAPAVMGQPTIGHQSMFEEYSEHLVKAGAYDVEYLIEKYGRPDGTISIDDLPRRKIRFDPPRRGDNSPLNMGGSWVRVDAPPPEPFKIPDLNDMTPDEIGGILEQAKQLGYITERAPKFDVAKVEHGTTSNP